MKPRTVVVFALVVILLLASWVIAVARTSPNGDPGSYKVESGIVTGKGFQLLNLNWQVSGALRGETYLKPDPASASSITSGCCCTFLPCVKR
jgi:hypothetical protein